MATEQRQRPAQTTVEAAEESTTDVAIIAAGASVALAWYQFFLRNNRERGLFVGLWPPTILAFASYFNQKRMEEKISGLRPSSIMESLDQVLSGR